jgi:hypothetical protein
MIVSSANKLASECELDLTPALVRGFFLIWQSELQRGKRNAEIKELDGGPQREPEPCPGIVDSFAARTFGVPEDTAGNTSRTNRKNWGSDLPDAEGW